MSKTLSARDTSPTYKSAVRLQIGAWLLLTAVSLIAITAWGQGYEWRLVPVNNYQLFPLLGLLAFSIMWSHYIVGKLGELGGFDKKVLFRYFESTGWLVLLLICLHPGLLIYQRFRDGYGLPPHSYESYVAPGLGWVTLLGTVSFLVFLAFEFRRFFGEKAWWHFVTEAGDLAMLAIIYHGLRLGGQLQHGWFQVVWWFYTVALVAVLTHSYANKYFRNKT